jgi:hypothetical protein
MRDGATIVDCLLMEHGFNDRQAPSLESRASPRHAHPNGTSPPCSSSGDQPQAKNGGGALSVTHKKAITDTWTPEMLRTPASARGKKEVVNLVCLPLLDREAAGGETLVRGVMQVGRCLLH